MLAVVITAGLYALSVMIYNEFFGVRYETNELMAFSVSDFGGLKCEEHFFTSDKGQKLAGYLYTSNDTTYADKIVVIAHGLGGGGHIRAAGCEISGDLDEVRGKILELAGKYFGV